MKRSYLVATLCTLALALTCCLWGCTQTEPATSDGDKEAIPIEVVDEESIVESCPTSAKPGEDVRVSLRDATDVELHVSVNGDEHYGSWAGLTYEFTMPDEPVSVKAWMSEYDGFTGA